MPRPPELPTPCAFCGATRGVRESGRLVCGSCGWRVGDVPDFELPPPRIDVVYYLRFRDRVKIGTTHNPRQRFAALRFDELLAFEPGDRHQEHNRHIEFAATRFERSEWFQLDDALLSHVEALRAGVDDPWLLHRRLVCAAYRERL
jgi:hypothetical protein